ncbi:C-terminal binding protein [bacterium]|nr:C-terminal binding protein [bacterium]NUP94503.1 C-terminal binding protein [Candidatus Omnitrophota bacterium]
MKVIVTDFIESNLAWEQDLFQQQGIDFYPFQLKYASEEELAAAGSDADVVIVNMAPISEQVIAGWTRCSLVIRHGIGYDNVDVEALSRRGIPLVNIPDYCVEEVAEQTIALILSLGRKVAFSRMILEASVQRGSWDFSDIYPIHRMRGQTLGIIGCGRIGSRVYEKLKEFGFKFAFCDPYLSNTRKNAMGIRTEPLDEVLVRSDFITLHTPLNSETEMLINEKTLRLMKPSAYLINTARAGLIDQNALVCALKEGRIAGAALDVFIPEPPLPEEELLGMENVILTPHLSWCSVESEQTIREKIVDQVLRFRDGHSLDNIVNWEALKLLEAPR